VKLNPMEQFTVRPIGPEWHLPYRYFTLAFTNQALWMSIVVGAASLFMLVAVSSPKLVPGRLQSTAELAYEFVANMIRSAAGEDGLVFFPFVFTIFVFVLFSNFFGLLPGAFTVTSQIAVTLALACLVILTVIVTGFAVHGIGFLADTTQEAADILWPAYSTTFTRIGRERGEGQKRQPQGKPAGAHGLAAPDCWPRTGMRPTKLETPKTKPPAWVSIRRPALKVRSTGQVAKPVYPRGWSTKLASLARP